MYEPGMKPLAIDLFCGLGGWAEGFLSEGYDVVGFDNHRHVYGDQKYPAQLVLEDVLHLCGKQFRNAAVIVASPPCQAYSWMAQPWSLAKAKAVWYCEDYTRQLELNCLFNACFRIAHEAGVPLVVENVRGAQPWVGRAKAHYGSFYLWGDVESIGNAIVSTQPKFGELLRPAQRVALKRGVTHRGDGSTNFHGGMKVPSESGRRTDIGRGARFTSTDCGVEGIKQGGDWFGKGEDCSIARLSSSKSPARKAASAQIAKIPFPLARHIARMFNAH